MKSRTNAAQGQERHRVDGTARIVDGPLALLIEQAEDYALVTTDPGGRITDWSRGAERILGWSASEAIGRSATFFFTAEDQAAGVPEQEVATAKQNGRASDTRWHLKKDGTRFFADGLMMPLRDSDGTLLGFGKILRDITERHRTEEELTRVTAESDRDKRLYEAVLNSTPDLAYVWNLDHRFTYANESLLKMWGKSWDEAIGKTCLELGYEPWHAAMHDREIEEVRATKQPVRGEVPFTGTFGRRIYDYLLVPVFGPNGEVEAVAGTTRDVTERKEHEEQLRASEDRYRTILEGMNEGLFALDRDYRFTYVNAASERTNGQRREDLLGKTHWEVYPAGIGTPLEAGIRRAMTERVATEFENYYEPWGRWFAVKTHPAPDGGIFIQYRDITDAKRAEGELRSSEERFRQLAETIPQLAWMAHPDGHIFWYNRRWYEYTGATPEQMEGWGWQRVHDPEVLPDVLARWKHSIATGQPFNMVFPLKGADGTSRPFLTLVNPLRGPGGELVSWFGTNTDISEQKRTEENLARLAAAEKERSELLARLAAASRQVNAVLSAESIVRIVTEEARQLLDARLATTTFTAAEDCTQEIRATVPAGRNGIPTPRLDPSSDMELAARVCRDNRPIRLPRNPSGSSPWCRLAVPLIGHGGKNLGVIQLVAKERGEFTDEDEAILVQLAAIASVGIENARLYERVRDQDRRKDEFLATLAHELRNPLAPVRSGLQILQRGAQEQRQKALDMMERQIGHMVRIIDDLLDVSRITSGKVALRLERVDVRAVLDAALEVSRPAIDASRHALIVSWPNDSLPLNVDLTRMAQVVSNLLNNAAKYTPEGGRIELSAEREGNEAVIRVRDNGTGIAKEMLPKVFELFTQVGRTIDRSQGGLGIGLALVARLVEMHGGTVTVESGGLGQGSTFTVRLPLAEDAGAHPAEGEGDAMVATGPVISRRILVVDDNIDSAESLALLLSLSGHSTQTAHSGPDALLVAQAFKPDVVFLDIGLPGMNGYEVAHRLRGNVTLDGLVIVAVTGWGTEDDRRRSKEAGFDHHLTKPVEADKVNELLDRLPADRNGVSRRG